MAGVGISFWWKNKRDSNAAIDRVLILPEVKEYLRTVPGAIVEIDHEDRTTSSYVIHVYEIKDGHSATFNWYNVDKSTGRAEKEF